jgi:hypothetical protein
MAANWHAINNGLKNLYVGSLVMHPQIRIFCWQVLEIIPSRKVRSVYNQKWGESWTQTLQLYAVTSVEISAATRIERMPEIFTEFYRSVDGGMNWIQVNKASEDGGHPVYWVDNLLTQADPRDPDVVCQCVWWWKFHNRRCRSYLEGYIQRLYRFYASRYRRRPHIPDIICSWTKPVFFEESYGGSNWDTPTEVFRNNDYHVIALNPSNPSSLLPN